MSVGLLIAIVVAVAVVAFVWLTYNQLVARRLAASNSWAQIDVALRRRHDLIPALVDSVKGYASHERTTFVNVTEARSAAVNAESPPNRAAAESTLARAVDGLLVVAEAYPQLEASENFAALQHELSETEDQIAITRRVYNDTVETYNTATQVFPAVIVARSFGFDAKGFFDAPDAAEQAPVVSLSPTSPEGRSR